MAGLSNLIPLIVLLVIVGVGGFIGYGMYQWSNELKERANKKMEKKNMSFTKEGGLRVGVKDIGEENYADKTQNVLVNVWNNASFPNAKSRFGWMSENKKSGSIPASAPRQSVAQTSPSQPRVGRMAMSSAANLSPAEHVSHQRRSGSPVPGSWN